jgi:deoxyribonuclease-2
MAALLLLVTVTVVGITQGLPQCRDENNNTVDWYVLYKLPVIKTSSNSLIRKGLGYAYITSGSVSRGWVVSNFSINDTRSIPGRTLEPLYKSSRAFKKNSLLWVLYNDQAPNKTYSSALGHTKGVVMSETDGGLWLVHSVPKFPPPPTNSSRNKSYYSYPQSGRYYGQSFLCISLTDSQLDLVGVQLTYNEPQIYSSNVPASLEENLPHLAAAARKKRVTAAPWYHQQQITSQGGQTFYSFAKAGKFNKELYMDWVAPTLRSNLLVETWQNGRGKLPSSCGRKFVVENVSSVTLNADNVRFKSTEDHSKWAAAYKDWVCIGDINRMENQERRGGGTVCINHPSLWLQYKQIISGTDHCMADQ